jgi:hypothetical protein
MTPRALKEQNVIGVVRDQDQAVVRRVGKLLLVVRASPTRRRGDQDDIAGRP